jgi:hypothetical protein
VRRGSRVRILSSASTVTDLRRKIGRQRNKGESLQTEQALCLTVVTNAVVHPAVSTPLQSRL